MSIHVRESGSYELIESIRGTQMLGLNGEKWFAWIESEEGEILVLSSDEHKRRRMVDQGNFLLVHFEDEAEYRDMPHLFLGHPGLYEEYILPNGLPDEDNARKKIISTDITIGREELEHYIASSDSDQNLELESTGDDLPIDDYEDLTVDEIAERLVALGPEDIEKLRRYEETHKDRKSLRHMFNRHLEGAH